MTASLRPDGEDGPVSQQETQIRVEEVLVCPVWCFLTGRRLRTQRASSSVLQEVGWYSGGVAEALKHESLSEQTQGGGGGGEGRGRREMRGGRG